MYTKNFFSSHINFDSNRFCTILVNFLVSQTWKSRCFNLKKMKKMPVAHSFWFYFFKFKTSNTTYLTHLKTSQNPGVPFNIRAEMVRKKLLAEGLFNLPPKIVKSIYVTLSWTSRGIFRKVLVWRPSLSEKTLRKNFQPIAPWFKKCCSKN